MVISGVLIGDPVESSISHLIYPDLFLKHGINGVFEKCLIKKGDLDSFFNGDIDYDFITVTMPFKIDVMEYCDELTDVARACGAVNYLTHRSGIIKGFNYDGIAALNVIEEHARVQDKTVVVYGCGGAGRAAIYEAKKRGANVICVNRNIKRAEDVAENFSVLWTKHIPLKFDVFINATPIGMEDNDNRAIFKPSLHLGGKVILDMASRTTNNLLSHKTVADGGLYISGKEMFFNLTISALENLQASIYREL